MLYYHMVITVSINKRISPTTLHRPSAQWMMRRNQCAGRASKVPQAGQNVQHRKIPHFTRFESKPRSHLFRAILQARVACLIGFAG